MDNTKDKNALASVKTFNNIREQLALYLKDKKEQPKGANIKDFLWDFMRPLLSLDESEIKSLYGTEGFFHVIHAAQFIKLMAESANINMEELANDSGNTQEVNYFKSMFNTLLSGNTGEDF